MFRTVKGKIGNMRKAVEWVVYPAKEGSTERIIQSERRIAKIDIESGKTILSNGKGGHQGFHKLLSITGAKEVECPQDILQQLKNLDEDHGKQEGEVVVLDGKGFQSVEAR